MEFAADIFPNIDPVETPNYEVERLAGQAAYENPELAQRIEFNIYNQDGVLPTE